MNKNEYKNNEITFDPVDWEKMKELGSIMLNDMIDYTMNIREKKAWQKPTDEARNKFSEALPEDSTNPHELYKEFCEFILPHTYGSLHPRFWGWVTGTGSPIGMFAEMLAAGVNSANFGGDHSAAHLEKQVIEWLKSFINFPSSASGILLGGASMSNLYGLTIARNSIEGLDIRKSGLQNFDSKLITYCSDETHYSVFKNIELLGLGRDSIRLIPVNEDFEIDLDKLNEEIETDIKEGAKPFCIVGNLGTVNSGAIDDLGALSEICNKYKMWFHIDGAFGVFATTLDEYKKYLSGLQKADSLAFDLHKWLQVPYESACLLVRNSELHKSSFTFKASYTLEHERGISAGYSFKDLGIELSRGFRALKVWFLLKEQGTNNFKKLFKQNIEQARYLNKLIDSNPNLELLAPVSINIVCFRYNNDKLGESELNELNKNLLMDIQETGIAIPSSTIIKGKYALRVCIVNHRTKFEDMDIFVRNVQKIGDKLSAEYV